MAKDKSAHVAAPVTHVVEGETWELSPLVISDFKQLERHLQEDAIEAVKPTLDGLPEALAVALLEKAHAESLRRRIGTDAFNEAAMSVRGICYMLWLSLRKKHTDATIETAETLLNADPVGLNKKVAAMAGWRASDDPFPKAK